MNLSFLSVRIRKALRDLSVDKVRTALVVLAIAVGVFSISTISRTRFIFGENIVEAYLAINPAHAYISVDSIDDDRLEWALMGLGVIDLRAGLLEADQTLKTVYDPYSFVRDAYLQHRLAKVYDGDPPTPQIQDPGDGAVAPPWESN